jgi:hypothetical protein
LGDMVEDFVEDIKRGVGDVAFHTMRPAIMKSSLGVAMGKAAIDFIQKKANDAPTHKTQNDQDRGNGVIVSQPVVSAK